MTRIAGTTTTSSMPIFCAFRDPVSSIKDPQDLTPNEQKSLIGLLKNIYEDGFKVRGIAPFYQTTLYVNPKTGKKLNRPIVTLSAVPDSPYYCATNPGLKNKLEDNIGKTVAILDESGRTKILRIAEWDIDINPGGGGGSVGMSWDMVTICPLKIEITEK